MANYLLSVAALSAAGSLFLQGDTGAPMTWAYLALFALACIIAMRAFAHGVFGQGFRPAKTDRAGSIERSTIDCGHLVA